MAGLDALLEYAQAWRGAPMAIATVVSTWGSAPRPRGAHMLIHSDGRFAGSVSGGCVEGDVLHMAAAVIASGHSRLQSYGVADAAAWEVGMPCGGEIRILVQPVSAAGFPPSLFEDIRRSRARGESLSVATDLESGQSRIGDAPGAFINLYRPPRRILIVGAVQIAQALARIAPQIDAKPIVIDPRARFLTQERFPGVDHDDRWPDEAIAAHAPDRSTAVVTLSHDPKIDDPALAAALRLPTGHIAALGSRRSHAARLERLAAQGFTADALARIEGPAGLAIGAIGPGEIALSIAAGIVKALNDDRFNDRG
ncbi:XdhC family protein [Sphingobium aquiterrae]|uniref:XdhC family protein n=1 Tax=Sphingobium aquiterrae TaxID=2038656 RepID=UPI003018DF69